MIHVKRISAGSEHLDQKWIVLEGTVDGVPEVTKRRTINTAALASGDVSFDMERDRLIADVQEYHDRWLAVQEAVKQL